MGLAQVLVDEHDPSDDLGIAGNPIAICLTSGGAHRQELIALLWLLL
jgi:hypothetical protein